MRVLPRWRRADPIKTRSQRPGPFYLGRRQRGLPPEEVNRPRDRTNDPDVPLPPDPERHLDDLARCDQAPSLAQPAAGVPCRWPDRCGTRLIVVLRGHRRQARIQPCPAYTRPQGEREGYLARLAPSAVTQRTAGSGSAGFSFRCDGGSPGRVGQQRGDVGTVRAGPGRPILRRDDDPVRGDLDPVVEVCVGQLTAGAQPLPLAQHGGDVGGDRLGEPDQPADDQGGDAQRAAGTGQGVDKLGVGMAASFGEQAPMPARSPLARDSTTFSTPVAPDVDAEIAACCSYKTELVLSHLGTTWVACAISVGCVSDWG